MDKVGRTTMMPGDHILFKRGDTFTIGELSNYNGGGYNGTETNPIVIDAYGTGSKPILYGDFTNAVWTKRAGYDSIWVTYTGQYVSGSFGWEDLAGAWHLMTHVEGEIKFSLDNANNLDKYLKSFTASSYGPGSATNNACDSIYVKTWDGNTPKVRIFRMNMFTGNYLIVQNLEFRNWWTAAYGLDMGHTIFRNLKTLNNMSIALRFARSRYCSIDSCRSDSSAYTPHYLGGGGYRNMMRYDTTLATVDTVLGIYRWIELSAAGMQEDTADVAEHCYYENAMQGGMDSYYNVDDTVRYCKFINTSGGIYPMGTGWVFHDNVVVADGRYTAAISVDNTGAERCVFYNNVITCHGQGLRVATNAAGGTIKFYNNQVNCDYGNSRFVDFQTTTGVTSTNNIFTGAGTWTAGAWPNETVYSTVASFQTATGYETGSVWSSSPGAPTGTFTTTTDTLPIGGGVDTLKWTSQNAISANIDSGIGTVATSGSKAVTITTTTIFKLTLTGSSGLTTAYVKSVIVKKLLPIGTFTAKPDTLPIGGGVDTLKWTSQNATSASIDNGIGTVLINGSKTVTVTTTTVFKLTLTGPSGLTTYVDSVFVLQPPLPTGTFTATTDTLPLGGGVDTLKWTSQNATSANIDNGIGTVAISGSKAITVTTTTVFKLTLTGSSGSTTTYVKSVIVKTLLPIGTFTATPNPLPINGGKVTFKWTSQNATYAQIDNGIGTVPINGSIIKWVFHTTAFKLTLTGPNGSTSYIDSVFALVPPTVISFTVTPDTLPIGGGVDTLKWSSLDATSAIIDNGIGSVLPNGSITATVIANTVFKLTLTGPAGSATYIDSVVVLKKPVGTFIITPDTLQTIPGTVTLNWTSENATIATISPIIGKLDSPSGSKTVTVTSNTVFELTLYGPSGLVTTYVDSVIVLKPIAGIKSIGVPPRYYTLSQNYPNPFNSSTRIEYELPRAGFTSLKIYNSLGALISLLVSGYLQPGKYTIDWDASRCASGMYFYRLQTGAITVTKKLILLR
jgi:uncharacterized Zn-binding protein involved in type VI secretion